MDFVTFLAFLENWKFSLMIVGGFIPPVIISQVLGQYLGKLFDADEGIFIGVLFFGLLAAEAYAYDRLQTWCYFRKSPE